MTALTRFLRRVRAFIWRDHADADYRDELRFHVDMEAAAIAQSGATPDHAHQEARRRFGSVDRYTEEIRDARGGRRIESFLQDVRYGVRLALRAPGFTATVILTIGLAIGANTAIFSVVNAVLLRPLPFAQSGAVVRVFAQNPDASQPRFSISYADYLDWQRGTHSFTNFSVFGSTVLTLAGDGEPERLPGLTVTRNFFDVLQTRPALGRLFGPEDDVADASPSVIISNGLWRRRFGSDSSIVGRAIPFGGRARIVRGVLAPDFWLDGRTIDAIVILSPSGLPGGETSHGQHLLEGIARLKPGVSVAQAQQDLNAVAVRVAESSGQPGWRANVFGFRDELVRGAQNPLLILLAAAVLVLLIGCINIANLLTVRAAARGREVGLRQALGASRGRLISQMLVESGVLAVAGGALGLVVASVGTRVLLSLVPAGTLPRLSDAGLDVPVLGFAFVLTILTALLVSVWPALRATDSGVARVLRDGGRGSAGSARASRARHGLVVAEMSLALVLLVCSALVLQSLYNIVDVDPGFRADRVSTMRLTLTGPRYADSGAVSFYREMLSRLAKRPGIEAAAAANTPPIAGGGIITPIRIIGRPQVGNDPVMSPMTAVTPGYFATMGMRIVRGHDVEWGMPQPTLVASEAAAKRLWPGEDALGKRVGFGKGTDDGLEIVGIVADAHARGLTTEPTPLLYMSYDGATNVARTMSLVIRGSGEQTDVLAATKSVLHELDPALPVYNVQSVQSVIDQSIAQPRLNTTLLTVFAAMALILAALGIYGVVSYTVTQRSQEFGVRMALGASTMDVLRMVLREGAGLAAIGVVLGGAGSYLATSVIRTWLFGVGRGDARTLVASAIALVGVALIASYLPARRATRVDPVMAMRGE